MGLRVLPMSSPKSWRQSPGRRDADPDALVLMGGTQPQMKYVEYMLDKGLSSSFDVVPVPATTRAGLCDGEAT